MPDTKWQTSKQYPSGRRSTHNPDADHWRIAKTSETSSNPLSLFSLQHTIGNRAVQRMLSHNSVVQRDTGSNGAGQPQPADNQKEKFAALLTIYVNGKKLKGTSKVSGHEEALEILSYQPVQTSNVNRRRDSSEEEGPTDTELILSKFMDGSSPALLEASAKGSPITFKLVAGKFDDDGKFNAYLTIESEDAHVSSYQLNQSAQDRPMDAFGIRYRPTKKK